MMTPSPILPQLFTPVMHFQREGEWVSSFLTAHQHNIGYTVSYLEKDMEFKYLQ